MTKTTKIVALLIITVIAFTFASTASALFVINGPGVAWQFAPELEKGTVIDANGYFYLSSDPNVREEMPDYTKLIITENLVTIIYSPKDTTALSGNVLLTGIHVVAENGEYDIAGPGFAFVRTR